MLAQQALLQPKSSLSGLVAPRSSCLSHDRFSPLPAFGGVPIRNFTGDAEHVLLHRLDERNPALLTSDPTWTFILDNTSLSRTTTFVSTTDTLHQVQEQAQGYGVQVPLQDKLRARLGVPSISCLAQHPRPTPLISRSADDTNSQQKDHVRPLTSPDVARPSLFPQTRSPLMIASASTPGTPPDLTESQSSKSSSYESRISSLEDFAGGNMNFEEIDLEDDNRTSSTGQDLGRSNSKENVRLPHNISKRPALATLQTLENRHLRSVENGVKSAVVPPGKRFFSSPTAPSVGSKSAARTRSESPTVHKPSSFPHLGPFSQTPATSLSIPKRRGSWQPSRRTIYEIEAEYHDSDDELPDDASLFNVPISPFPSHPRSAPRSARSSPHGSPEREPASTAPAPIPLSHSITAPSAPPKRRGGQKPLPRQRLTPRASSTGLTQSKSASTSPRTDARYGRTKSWNLVMADLDYESRIIAEKLDFHQEATLRTNSAATSPFRSSAPGAIPLPPVQRGTLDFMPMSKEKEAVLSRTRPSWLPPKDPREEKKHLLEYQKMMKASIEAEKKREEKLKGLQNAKDETRESLHRIWTFYVDPTTDLNVIDRRVNDLCWRGIPSNLRGAVWQRTVGNPLGLNSDSFALAKKYVQEIKSRPLDEVTEYEKKMRGWFADIERDAETAFPDTSIFLKDGPQHKDLIDVCEAYASSRAETGYIYGIQLIAALILLQVPNPPEAFILLANCLSRTMPRAFQTGDIDATARTYGKVKSTLDIKFPRLHAYLFNEEDQGGLGFTGEELFETMFRTLFANGLDPDRLCRVWDIWIFESDRYLVRTAVALLGAVQIQIFDIQGDIHLRRRNIQEMLGWGPFNRDQSGYWKFDIPGGGDSFVEDIRAAGRLDTAGR